MSKHENRQGRYEDFVQFDEAQGLVEAKKNLEGTQVDRKPTESQLPHEVPAGVETAVPKGMIPAVGVIPHPDQQTYPGVLVMARNTNEVVCWHNKGCTRKGITPGAVKFDRNGAPWCPTCFAENLHRDPDWNSEPTPAINVPAPINSPKSEATAEHRIDREDRIAAIRAARETGQFKDPVTKKLVEDDRLVTGFGVMAQDGTMLSPPNEGALEAASEQAYEIRPPERFGD